MAKQPEAQILRPVDPQYGRYDPAATTETDSLRYAPSVPRESLWTAIVTWRLEIGSLSLAIGILIAIYVTLGHYSDQDVPEWPLSLNLNSLIAIYSTVLRALLIFPVAEVISQEKWFWFQRPRPLRDLDAFDLGSRGLWGCIKLLVVAYSSAVPFIAAVTTIILIALDPFSQQSVRTAVCTRIVHGPLAAGAEALIPIAARIPRSEIRPDTFGNPRALSPESLNSVLAGLANPEFMANPSTLPFTCPSGNCTFPSFGEVTYSSLGMCSQCEDLTSVVTHTRCPERSRGDFGGNEFDNYMDCNLTFAPPGGPTIWAQVAENPLRVATTGQDTKPYDMFSISVLTRSLVGCAGRRGDGGCPEIPNLPGLRNRQFNFTTVGAKCSLYPCIKHYNGRVAQGQLIERVVSSPKLDATIDSSVTGLVSGLAGVANPCITNGTMFDSANGTLAMSIYGQRELNFTTASNATAGRQVPAACVHEIDVAWMNVIGKRIADTFSGNCNVTGRPRGRSAFVPMNCPDAYWLDMIYANDTATFQSITKHFENVAASVTNRMRSIGLNWAAQPGFANASSERAFATGAVETLRVCYLFKWEWLLLPTALTFITFCLLTASVMRTWFKRSPAWKSSALPLLFHGFREPVDGMNLERRMNLPEMERVAASLVVHFADEAHGGPGVVADKTPASHAYATPD